MGWTLPKYAHIAPITKIDGSSRRKLSKRKDPEANVAFYVEEGYPKEAVIEYLLNLANSNFEDWHRENPLAPHENFQIDLARGNVSGALFDFVKLGDVSKQIIARMTVDDTCAAVEKWARQFHPEFAVRIAENPEYIHGIFGIEHENEKRRKDLAKWSDAPAQCAFFFDDIFAAESFTWNEKLSCAVVDEILEKYQVDFSVSAEEWLSNLRIFAQNMGFAPDTKTFKAAPENFKGHLGDVAGVLRMALTKRTNTPDLYEMMHVMGEDRVRARFAAARESAKI
jgi:glutamyl-tRNA synthetase